MIKIIHSLIVALPELIKLVKNIEKQIEAKKTDEKVKDDLKKINEAFEKKDAEALNKLFNSN